MHATERGKAKAPPRSAPTAASAILRAGGGAVRVGAARVVAGALAPPEAQPAPLEHAAAPPPPSAQRAAPSEVAPLPGVGAGCCAGARACVGANAAGAAGPLVPPPALARGFAAGGGEAASAAFTPFASRGAAPTSAAE